MEHSVLIDAVRYFGLNDFYVYISLIVAGSLMTTFLLLLINRR